VVGDDQRDHAELDGSLDIPSTQAIKRFNQFLRIETRSLGSDEPYAHQLMRQQGAHRVIDVDLHDVKAYDALLGQLLEENPNKYLPLVRCLPIDAP
jgi:hypothetical protein